MEPKGTPTEIINKLNAEMTKVDKLTKVKDGWGKQGAVFFFSSRRRHTRSLRDWSSDVCSSDLNRGTSSARAVPAGGLVSRRGQWVLPAPLQSGQTARGGYLERDGFQLLSH